MKKNIMILLGLLMMVTFASSSWALTITGGTTITGAPSLSFTPSPSSVMAADTIATDFSITSASSKTTTANGLEYAMVSTNGNIYQRTQVGNGVVEDPETAAVDVVPTGYSVKGGGS